jgi:hypothetical protein
MDKKVNKVTVEYEDGTQKIYDKNYFLVVLGGMKVKLISSTNPEKINDW